MCITQERLATRQEMMNYKLALYTREITDNCKTIASVCVDLMQGKNPETPLQIRIDAARQLIESGEFIPAPADPR